MCSMHSGLPMRLEPTNPDIENFFSPENDPFVTAGTLSENREKASKGTADFKPVSVTTCNKASSIGNSHYLLGECIGKYASILFPIATTYVKEASTGLSRVWQYTVEYPVL